MHNPIEGRRLLAASYAQLGRLDEAREQARLLLEAHPNFSLDHWSSILPDRLEEETMHYVEGLEKSRASLNIERIPKQATVLNNFSTLA